MLKLSSFPDKNAASYPTVNIKRKKTLINVKFLKI